MLHYRQRQVAKLATFLAYLVAKFHLFFLLTKQSHLRALPACCCCCFFFSFQFFTVNSLFLVSCLSPERDSKKNGKLKSEPGQDPGSDPDLVSSGQLPDQALKAVGVQPGAKHQGSVRSLLEGKEDVDIAGVELSKEQVKLSTIESL